MELHKAKKVVVVTEAILLNRIVDTMAKLGVHGYTVQGASGAGERGVRTGDEAGGIYKNVRIDVITNKEMAHKLAALIVEKYFANYAGIIYMEDVEVVRAAKFQVT